MNAVDIDAAPDDRDDVAMSAKLEFVYKENSRSGKRYHWHEVDEPAIRSFVAAAS